MGFLTTMSFLTTQVSWPFTRQEDWIQSRLWHGSLQTAVDGSWFG